MSCLDIYMQKTNSFYFPFHPKIFRNCNACNESLDRHWRDFTKIRFVENIAYLKSYTRRPVLFCNALMCGVGMIVRVKVEVLQNTCS